MTDTQVLLERHQPRLVYDSHEAYFADSAAIWTDSPTNLLTRADRSLIAAPPKLSLAFLGTKAYADGAPVQAGDMIGDSTRDYAKHAAALHAKPQYRDRVYGHARKDSQGHLWLQYWLFYYYNDFQLLGPLTGGKHEGDWELVQLRLDAGEHPMQAVYSQHKTAESKAWADVPKHGANTPVVYVARGSHANYFGTGSQWTGTWFDQADGKGPQISPTVEPVGDDAPVWLHWPGWWGDTKAGSLPADAQSPISPARRVHWLDPSKLSGVGPLAAPAPPPQPPQATAHRDATGHHIIVDYEAEPDASALVVALRPKGSDAPATTRAFPLTDAKGEVEVPAGDEDYDVWTSVVAPERGASEGKKAS